MFIMLYELYFRKLYNSHILEYIFFSTVCSEIALNKIEMFCSQAQTGGIVMVSFYPHFISCGEKSTLQDVAGERKEFQF